METRALAQRVLARAALRIGGADRLARYLAVEPATLDAILRAVDLVVDERNALTS